MEPKTQSLLCMWGE